MISNRVLCAVLGKSMCACLPFVHVVSGCDTTSVMYGIGKAKPFKLIASSGTYQKAAMMFRDSTSDLEKIRKFGTEFILKLYYSNKA